MADSDSIRAKRCTQCNEFKAPTEFHRNKASPDGLATDCKTCCCARAKAWFEANKERARAANRARYLRDPERAKKRAREWELSNPERKRQLAAAAKARDPERVLGYGRKDWAKHNERRRAAKKSYREANPERGVEYVRARQTRKQQAMPVWADRAAILAIYTECRRISAATGIKHHVDHIYPLKGATVCGLHNEFNLQVIAAAENQSKHNKVIEW